VLHDFEHRDYRAAPNLHEFQAASLAPAKALTSPHSPRINHLRRFPLLLHFARSLQGSSKVDGTFA